MPPRPKNTEIWVVNMNLSMGTLCGQIFCLCSKDDVGRKHAFYGYIIFWEI